MFEMNDDPPPFKVLPALTGKTPAVTAAAVTAMVTANVRRSFMFKFPPGFMCCPSNKGTRRW